jgi:hypothetical protein
MLYDSPQCGRVFVERSPAWHAQIHEQLQNRTLNSGKLSPVMQAIAPEVDLAVTM